MRKEPKLQKGFIQIPLLMGIVLFIMVSGIGAGTVLYKQDKLSSLTASIVQIFEKKKEIVIPEEEKVGIEELQQTETNQDTISQKVAELEIAKQKADLEAKTAKAETERLKREAEEVKRY